MRRRGGREGGGRGGGREGEREKGEEEEEEKKEEEEEEAREEEEEEKKGLLTKRSEMEVVYKESAFGIGSGSQCNKTRNKNTSSILFDKKEEK